MRDWGLGTKGLGTGKEFSKYPVPNPQYPMPNEVDKRLVSIVNNLVANVIE